jgi:hypothetical protein
MMRVKREKDPRLGQTVGLFTIRRCASQALIGSVGTVGTN